MATDNPITGPYPDGDSRNITLTKSDNRPIEPARTGPQEHKFRSDNDESDDGAETAQSSSDGDDGNNRAPRYEEQTSEPSAAQTAFGRPCGALEEPVLQKDWNPAERNSDDLSR